MSWPLRRWLISAFVTFHLVAVGLWVMPDCALKERCAGWTPYYLLPLGLWQQWGMFAPEPVRSTVALEALVVDQRGQTRTFAFPRMADRSPWQGIWGFRHSKLTANLGLPEYTAHREFAARHVIRSLGLSPTDFPVDVQLRYQVRATPEPAGPPVDPMAPPSLLTIATYRFPTWEEAQP